MDETLTLAAPVCLEPVGAPLPAVPLNPSTDPKAVFPCSHCQRPTRKRARGLCGTCHLKPQIRDLYPTLLSSRPDRFRTPVGMVEPKVYGAPTAAMPGSEEKIAILAARVEAGLVLHHPEDRKEAVATYLRHHNTAASERRGQAFLQRQEGVPQPASPRRRNRLKV